MPLVFGQFDVDAAILDLDGTMVDTMGDFVAVLNAMLADLPAPYPARRVDRRLVEPLVGKGSENLVKSVLALVDKAEDAPVSGAIQGGGETSSGLLEHALACYQGHYLAINGQHATVYPGVLEGLQQLQSRGLKMACVTNKPTRFAVDLLRAKGLGGFFDVTFGGDAFARKKPDPEPLTRACAALGVSPQRTLMVGDSSNDAQAARGAGCPVLLVTYGYNHGEPIHQVDADGFTESLRRV